MFAWGLSRGEALNRMRKVHQDVVRVVSDSVECTPVGCLPRRGPKVLIAKRNGPPQESP
jgi:hypothetical protein